MTDFDIDVPESIPPQNEKVEQAMENKTAIDLPDIMVGKQHSNINATVESDIKELAVKFGIIGTGQGGSRLADTFWQIGYRRVCAINTTAQDFLGLQIPQKNQKVLEAGNDTMGGAGKDIAKGEEAIKKCSEDVISLMQNSFGEDVDHIMICVGMGGGSGTGTTMHLIKLAKYYLKHLGKPEKIGIMVTLPKFSEGGMVQANAANLLEKLEPLAQTKELSPFIVVDNQSIHQMFPMVPAKIFWQTANKNTVGLFDIFNVLASQKSQYTTFDRADYRSVLDSGLIVFGATKLEKYSSDTDISDGLRTNLKRTLLADVDMESASHVAAILAAPDAILGILPQSHIDLAFETLERMLGGQNRKLVVHQGVYEASKNGLFLYTMVGGLKLPKKRIDMLKARAGMDL